MPSDYRWRYPIGVTRKYFWVVDVAPRALHRHVRNNETCSGTAPSGGTGVPQPTGICYHTDNLYCDVAQTCQPLVGIGATCASDGCVMGAFCNAGTCVAGLPNGSICTQDAECAASSCVFSDNGVGEDMPVMGTCGSLAVANAKTCAGDFQ